MKTQEMMNMMDPFGPKVILSAACADTVQRKRHRKKRINKKWRKRHGVKTVPWKTALLDTRTGTMTMHPDMYYAVKNAMEVRPSDKF